MRVEFVLPIFLVSCGGLRYSGNSTEEFIQSVTSNGLDLIFQSMNLNYESTRTGLLKLLLNNFMSMRHYYLGICKRWSVETLKLMLDWSLGLPTRERHILMDTLCSSGSFSNNYLFQDLYLENNLPVIYESTVLLDERRWLKILEGDSLYYRKEWCLIINGNLIRRDFLAKLNLPGIMSCSCLLNDYPGKGTIMDAFIDQIGVAKDISMTRLLLTTSICPYPFHDSDLLPRVEGKVCKNYRNNHLSFLNAQVFKCDGVDLSDKEHFAFVLADDSYSKEDKLFFVQGWLGIHSITDTIKVVSKLKVSLAEAITSYTLNFGLALISFPIKHRRNLCKHLGLNYDNLLLDIERSQLKMTNHEFMWEMPFGWRIKFFRFYFLTPSSSSTLNLRRSIRTRIRDIHHQELLLGADMDFEAVKSYLTLMVRDLDNFACKPRSTHSEKPVCRPRVWIEKKRLKVFVNLLIYSIIRWGKTIILIDGDYCKESTGYEPEMHRMLISDYKFGSINRQSRGSEAVPFQFFNFRYAHKYFEQRGVLDKLFEKWELGVLLQNGSACWLLTKNFNLKSYT